MRNKTQNLYAFGDFKLDTGERVLYRNEQILRLAPKVFETLLSLVESGGNIISKEELMNEIWHDAYVEESNLTQNIYILRQVFGKRNKFIETIPRRGYRFTAEISLIQNEEDLTPLKSSQDLSEVIVSRKTTTTFLQEEIIEEDNDEASLDSKKKLLSGDSVKYYYRSRRFRIGLTIGALATLLVGTIGLLIWQENLAQPSKGLLENISFTNLTETGDVRQIAISPDGQFLAFIKDDREKAKTIWLKDINSKQDLPLNIADEFRPQALHFSPDGNSIYFLNHNNNVSGEEIYKTTRFGGKAEFVAENVWSEFSISADGSKIAFFRKLGESNQHWLVIRNLLDKTEKVLLAKNFPDGFDLRSSPAFSPDTKEIYAIVRPQDKPLSTLVKVNLETGQEKALNVPQIRQFVSVVALPDNENLIFTAREPERFPQIYKVRKDGGAFHRLTNDLNIYRKITISSDGKNLVALQKTNLAHLWFLPESKAEKSQQLTFGKNNRDGKKGLDVLPDGKIVFTSLEDLNRDLWLYNPADGSKQQLTIGNGDANENPFISPDSRNIYFHSLNENTFNIERIGANGQDLQSVTASDSANDLFPNVSNDSTTLYFIRKTKGKSVVMQKNLMDNIETELKLPTGFLPSGYLAISPEGKFLAFRQADLEKRNDPDEEVSAPVKIGIISTEGDLEKARSLEINTIPSQFRWSREGDALYFINHTPDASTIWKQSIFEKNEPQKIVELKDGRIYHFQFTGQNDLVISQGRNFDDAVLIQNID